MRVLIDFAGGEKELFLAASALRRASHIASTEWEVDTLHDLAHALENAVAFDVSVGSHGDRRICLCICSPEMSQFYWITSQGLIPLTDEQLAIMPSTGWT